MQTILQRETERLCGDSTQKCNLKKYENRLAELTEKMESILADSDGRTLSGSEKQQFDALEAEHSRISDLPRPLGITLDSPGGRRNHSSAEEYIDQYGKKVYCLTPQRTTGRPARAERRGLQTTQFG